MSPRTPAATHPEVVSEEIPGRRPGWIELVTSSDHKSVGRMYIATSLFFAAIALTELVMMRIQLMIPDNTLIRPEIFDRLMSAYGATALILFLLPLAVGLISYVAPLQVGARGVALPRLHHLSYWLYLFGGITIYASFLYRPSEAGTVALAPLSDNVFLPNAGVDAWIVGVGLALLGFVFFAISMIATIRATRAPGIVWRRLPLFSWASIVISYTLLVVSSVMVAALTMLMIDRHFDGIFFDPGMGGSPILYEHLSSIFLAGAYVSVVLLAFGAISEIIPTFSRQPHFGHGTIAASFVAFAVLGVLAWMQNMVAAPMAIGLLYFAMLMAAAAIVPVGLILFNWFGTMSGGSVRMRAPMLFAMGAIVLTTLGLVGELAQSVVAVGWQLNNTGVASGDTYAALVGAGVLGGFAALHYWFPKLSGRMMGESLGRASFWAIILGAVLYIVPTQLAGLEGMPVDVYKFYADTGMSFYNLLASIGTIILSIGVLMTLLNAASSYTKGTRVGPDPWGGSTLEWFAPSPPPAHNFDLVPDVRSTEPLRDIREAVRRRETRWNPPPAVRPDREPEPVSAGSVSGGESAVGTGTDASSGRIGEAESDPAEESTSGDEGDRPVA